MFRIHVFDRPREQAPRPRRSALALHGGSGLFAALLVVLLGGACGERERAASEVGAASAEGAAGAQGLASEDAVSRDRAAELPARRFVFRYEVRIDPIAEAEAIDLFVPIATHDDAQTIEALAIDSPREGRLANEATYGNRFWHLAVDGSLEEPLTIAFEYTVARRELGPFVAERARAALSAEERDRHALYLGPNARVPVDAPILDPILAEVRAAAEDARPLTIARAIYDWVVDHVEYKKVGSGWGHGDTYWACIERYGNCTDFHALFTSLSRNQGIPARFEIGFPVPQDRREGAIGGYHCWLQVFVPGIGWMPIDASDAFNHPERREQLFGSQPADRIGFTRGRDLQLGERHRSDPLNYFVYPHLEVDGLRREQGVEARFSFRDLEPDPSVETAFAPAAEDG